MERLFCSLLNPTNPEKATSPSLEPLELDPSVLNESFSYEEVKAAVLSNDNNKSPGYDQIKHMFIKNEACIRFLLTLFITIVSITELLLKLGLNYN